MYADARLEAIVARVRLVGFEPAHLLQQEIVDETDIYEDVNTGLRRGGQRVDVANLLAMFEHKLNHLQVGLAIPTEWRAQNLASLNAAIVHLTEAFICLTNRASVCIIHLSEVYHFIRPECAESSQTSTWLG